MPSLCYTISVEPASTQQGSALKSEGLRPGRLFIYPLYSTTPTASYRKRLLGELRLLGRFIDRLPDDFKNFGDSLRHHFVTIV